MSEQIMAILVVIFAAFGFVCFAIIAYWFLTMYLPKKFSERYVRRPDD